VNHQTWFIELRHKGRDISAETLLKALQSDPEIARSQKVRLDILKRFGHFSTESNGHLSEYVPWYRKRPGQLHRWIGMKEWNEGETGGYLRYCTERRHWFEVDFPKWLTAEDPPISSATRSHEHGSFIIEALETGRPYRGHFNVLNNGCIWNLPPDAIVEVPCYVDGHGINVPAVGELPLACAATLSATVNVQRMAVRAGVAGDVTLLKQAVLHDPLTAAVCDPPEIWQMVDRLLVAQAQWLPQYRREIPKARQRLAAEEDLGTHSLKGARRKTHTVAELRRSRKAPDITKVQSKTTE
jgi:alpha-galactosidase